METKVYAVKHKNKEIISKSSSGGLFTALTDVFLKDGNAVASCLYNYENDKVEFKIYQNIETRNLARGSKYIQAEIGDGFKNVLDWLSENLDKSAIVFGTGCQMEGFRKYLELKGMRDRTIIVDIICHGATSPGLWKKYLEERNYQGKLQFLSFKDKRNGWNDPTVFAKINDEEIFITDFSEWFYGEWAIRDSCYKCPFTKVDRETDITIGDYWGIDSVMPDFADSMGVSLALVHTKRGVDLFEKIKNDIEWAESNKKDCLQPRLVSSANRPMNRIQFWEDINEKGTKYCAKKYKENKPKIPLWKKCGRKVKRILAR